MPPKTIEDRMTVRHALRYVERALQEAGIEEASIEAQWILADLLGTKRFEVFLQGSRRLTPAETKTLAGILKRRTRREPLAYILGRVDFRGHAIEVSDAVLIPRPETEELVDRALEVLKNTKRPALVLEPCTGSGCISIALALEGGPLSRIIALDISPEAIAMARKNALINAVSHKIDFLLADIQDLPLKNRQTFDIIVSNPPYVPYSEITSLAPEVRDFEPPEALSGGDDGLHHIRTIIRHAATLLKPGGYLVLEIGAGQYHGAEQAALQTLSFHSIQSYKDISGMDRILLAKK